MFVTLWRKVRLHSKLRQIISDIVQYSNSRWLDYRTWQDSQSQSVIQLYEVLVSQFRLFTWRCGSKEQLYVCSVGLNCSLYTHSGEACPYMRTRQPFRAPNSKESIKIKKREVFNFKSLALGLVRLITSEENGRKINNISIVIWLMYPLCRGRKTALTEFVDSLSANFIPSHKFKSAIFWLLSSRTWGNFTIAVQGENFAMQNFIEYCLFMW